MISAEQRIPRGAIRIGVFFFADCICTFRLASDLPPFVGASHWDASVD